MNVDIHPSWRAVLQPEFDKPYFELLTSYVRHQYQTCRCFPPAGLIFNAFNRCPFDDVRVVIIGQDPYHDDGQACGLSFLVPPGIQAPPSLVNIRREIERERGLGLLPPTPAEGGVFTQGLSADPFGQLQGVLLLNATLTVQAHHAGSHQGKGWEELTDAVIAALNRQREHLVFMLWGSYAQRKGQFIDRRRHLVLQTSHPSPLSVYRGFDGCGHFADANRYLQQHGLAPIHW